MEFQCRLASPDGEIIEGVYAAATEALLRRELEGRGLLVLSLAPKGALAGLSLRLPARGGVPTREFLVFNQELATLLRAGMPLVQSLELLRKQMASPVFRGVLNDVHERVRGGAALSDAFRAHGDLFPRVYTASLVAGERSGNLDAVLKRFVEYTKVIATVKRKTVSALVYPAILIVLSLVLVSIIVLKVVPAFSDFYASFNAPLPFITRVIVAFSDVVRSQAILLLLGVAAGGTGFALWVRQPGQKARFHRAILGVPVVGSVVRKFSTSQMSRTLATLLAGGLPLVSALDIAAQSVGNQFIARELELVGVQVREGVSFASALEARRVLPDVAVRMAEVGESTGALQDMLNAVADFYDEELSSDMDRFITLVEPVLLIVMGIVVAVLLLALYMPLFQLASVLAN